MKNKKRVVIFVFFISFLIVDCSSYKGVLLNETEKIIIYIYGPDDDKILNPYKKMNKSGY